MRESKLCNLVLVITSMVVLWGIETNASTFKIYDCAANSLYIRCRLEEKDVTYARCLELLPLRRGGNSMLEVKNALEELSFNVCPQRIMINELRDIRVPAIILDLGAEGQSNKMGHYLVISPKREGMVQILDYPKQPNLMHVDRLIMSLRAQGVTEVLILLCSTEHKTLQKMLTKISNEPVPHFRGIVGDEESTPDDVGYIEIYDTASGSHQSVINLGDCAEGSSVSGKYVVKNMTKRELVVSTLTPSCTCSEVTIDNKSISPGGVGIVEMKASLSKIWGPYHIYSTLIFSENSGQVPVFFKLIGKSHARWECMPNKICFPSSREDQRGVAVSTARILISEYSSGSIVTSLETSSPALDAALFKVAEGEYRVEIKLLTNMFTGTINERVYVYLDHEEKYGNFIDVQAINASEYVIEPATLLLWKKDGTTSVKITHCSEEEFRIMSYGAEGEQGKSITLDVTEKKQGVVKAMVNVKPKRAGMTGNVVIHVENSSGERKKLVLPYICL